MAREHYGGGVTCGRAPRVAGVGGVCFLYKYKTMIPTTRTTAVDGCCDGGTCGWVQVMCEWRTDERD
eukprot:1349057-Rhodomonas_salina.1